MAKKQKAQYVPIKSVGEWRALIEKALKKSGRYHPGLDFQIINLAAAMRTHDLAIQDIDGLDTRAVKRFFTFYEFLHFPGKRGLRRYKLTPVQAFQFASVYGFKHPDGRRVVREAVLFVPRKFSKTTGSAAFAMR